MGTSIDCIIPREKDFEIEELRKRLDDVFVRLKTEVLHLREFGHFSKRENTNEKWFLIFVPAHDNQPEYTMGEGFVFSVDIYKNVVLIGCTERFNSLYFKEKNTSDQLFKIITELAKEFCFSNRLLLGAGGFGDTDRVIDMAYSDHANFDQICAKMTELHGIPADNFDDLKDVPWYLS
ncbi:hypothetical protein [Flavobacterium sp. T12S277]|uniref:hypothetical protein n=1 Tax=Flavobacterium sp. T12S277 TaxID=3402752 RepID=UPI003AE394A1